MLLRCGRRRWSGRQPDGLRWQSKAASTGSILAVEPPPREVITTAAAHRVGTVSDGDDFPRLRRNARGAGSVLIGGVICVAQLVMHNLPAW